MKIVKFFCKLSVVVGLVISWFFMGQLGEAFYWMLGFGYLSLLSLALFSPRPRYWWWMFFEHSAFFLGFSFIAVPIFFSVNRVFGLILLVLGLFIVMSFGYAARMRMIGQPDPGLDIFLELRSKFNRKEGSE